MKINSLNLFKWFLVLTGILSVNVSHAQTEESTEKENFHRLTLVLGHTYVPTGLDVNDKRKWLTLASWGLDYDYWFSERWAAGLHTDMVIENFQVEVSDKINPNEVLKRTNPLSVVPSAIYKPTDVFNLIAGIGSEISKEENLLLLRLGTDFGWEIGKKYEVSISLVGDFKIEAYNSITIGIGISRIFR